MSDQTTTTHYGIHELDATGPSRAYSEVPSIGLLTGEAMAPRFDATADDEAMTDESPFAQSLTTFDYVQTILGVVAGVLFLAMIGSFALHLPVTGLFVAFCVDVVGLHCIRNRRVK